MYMLSIRRTGEGIDSLGFQLNTKSFRKFWAKALVGDLRTGASRTRGFLDRILDT